MDIIKFNRLEKQLTGRKARWREFFAAEAGSAYVLAVGRDGCPGCVRFKPVFKKLALSMKKKHGGAVSFSLIHISCPGGSRTESVRSKKLLGHYFYPAVLILIRSKDLGVFEYYRAVVTRTVDLNKQIASAVKAAGLLI